MSEVQIPAASPLVSYTGDGVQNVFSFPYYFAADTDLRVYVGGALATLGADYVATGVGVEAGDPLDSSIVAGAVLSRFIAQIAQSLSVVSNPNLHKES